MLSGFVSLAVAALLGQSPAESAWLKSIPADVDVAIHLRGVGPVKSDFTKMLSAMSPTAEQAVAPMLEQALQSMRQQISEKVMAEDSPIIAVIKLPTQAELASPAGPPFATLARVGDYAALQKSSLDLLGDVKIKHEAGGYDSVTGQAVGGAMATIYTFNGKGFAAVSNNEALIKAIAKPSGKMLDSKVSGEVANAFLGGDLGLFVDLEAAQARYGAQLDQIVKTLPDLVAQGNVQGGNPAQMQAGIEQITALIGAIKKGRGLAFDLDFGAEGFKLNGIATPKPDTAVAKALASAKAGTGASLDRLPRDATMYLYSNADPTSFARMQTSHLRAVGGEEMADALEQAAAANRAANLRETTGALTFDDGIRAIAFVNVDKPKLFLDTAMKISEAQKAKAGKSGAVEKVEITPNAETYQGISFTRTVTTLNLEKLAAQQPDPQAAKARLAKLMGGGTTTSWTGAQGDRVFTLTGKSWDAVKGPLDTALSGKNGLGSVKSYQAIRAQLPEKVGGLVLLNTQGLLRLFAFGLAASGAADVPKLPVLPSEPALFGGALTGTPAGYRFQFVVPSAVGPVVEQGLVPLLQGMQGGVAQ